MKLEHIAIWTRDIEVLREFYCSYFAATPNEKYTSTQDFGEYFESYFLTFPAGSRLEIMHMGRIPQGDNTGGYESTGITHLAFSVETRAELEALAARLKADGHRLVGEPHMTGDGYYEACVLDPDGNRVEITVPPAE